MSNTPDSAVAGKESSASPFIGGTPPKPIAGSETVVNPERRQAAAAVKADDSHSDSSLVKVLFPAEVSSGDELPMLDVDQIRIGHYQIQRRIGSGGMGAVFRALDTRLQRIVALKILAPAFARDTAAVQRFQNEARATAILDHDNIAGVFFIGESQGMHYIAYEYVQGKNIRDLIRERRRISNTDAINYTLQVATALQHMAANGVTHRDIKPSNIIVTDKGRAKLVDLGLARKQNEDSLGDLTVAGTTLGTFDYISPEQAKDPRNVDVRSDIYSLGCTIYHMLTGEPPYPEGTVLQKLLDHQGAEPPDPATKNRRVPPNLSAVVRRMMASDLRKRYATPEQLIRDLMMVAGTLGMRGTTTEGLVWTASASRRQSFWVRNLGLVSTAGVLLLIVGLMQWFPEFGKGKVIETQPENAADRERATESVSVAVDQLGGRSRPGASGAAGGSIADQPNGAELRSPSQPTLLAPGTELGPLRIQNDEYGKIFERISPLIIPGRIPFATDPDAFEGILGGPTDAAGSGTGEAIGGSPNLAEASGGGIGAPLEPVPPIGAPTIVLYSPLGETEQSFATLEAACAAAVDGSVIELRYSGRHPSGRSEKPLQITDKKVTIRARDGARPVIEFEASSAGDAPEQRMVRLNGGAIELVNVDLVMTVDEVAQDARCAFFSLDSARQVLLSGVTIRVRNESLQPVAVFELAGVDSGAPMGIGDDPDSLEPLEVSMTESIVAAAADLFFVDRPVNARLSMSESAFALFGCVLRQEEGPEMPSSSSQIELRIDRCTCVSAGVLDIRSDQLTTNLVPLTLTTSSSLFSSIDGVSHLTHIVGDGTNEELLRAFTSWFGTENIYDDVPGFLRLRSDLGDFDLMTLDFTQWRDYWAGIDGGGEVGSIESAARWDSIWTGRSVDEWTTEAFRFIAESPEESPEFNGMIDVEEVGADVSRLPVLKPYVESGLP